MTRFSILVRGTAPFPGFERDALHFERNAIRHALLGLVLLGCADDAVTHRVSIAHDGRDDQREAGFDCAADATSRGGDEKQTPGRIDAQRPPERDGDTEGRGGSDGAGRGGSTDAGVRKPIDAGPNGGSTDAGRRKPIDAGPNGGSTDAGRRRRADASADGSDEKPPPAPSDAAPPLRDASDDVGASPSADATTDRNETPPCGALGLKLLATDLKSPVYATAPAGDARIFVLERLSGRIVILDESGVRATPFLDVSSKMAQAGFEVGLLSLVFHPDFANNRTFYVSYTTLSNTLRISRFRVPATTPDVADPTSESIVIDIPKLSHHNTGGMLLFGPDGLLHIGVGDDDSEALGQDRSVLSGKLLRIFVDPSVDGYAIPPSNPFVGLDGVKPEIWAYGLREPYRFWFDGSDLYIADVGDNQREEIDVVAAGTQGGQNFGWPIMEGSLCHTPASGCDESGLQIPAYEYPHDGGTAVIGGGVYRGMGLPACFRGRYFFGSYSAGWLRTLRWDGGLTDAREEPGVLDPGFVSFGQDGHGEILMLGYDLTVHRVVSLP